MSSVIRLVRQSLVFFFSKWQLRSSFFFINARIKLGKEKRKILNVINITHELYL